MKKFLICLLVLSLLVVSMVSCSNDKGNETDREGMSVKDTLDSVTESAFESESESGFESNGEGEKESESDIELSEMTDDDQNWTPNY